VVKLFAYFVPFSAFIHSGATSAAKHTIGLNSRPACAMLSEIHEAQ
jgi:hypothetical protein